MDLASDIRGIIQAAGTAKAGFADLSPVDSRSRGGLPAGIAIVLPLTAAVIRDARRGATAALREDFIQASLRMKELHRLIADRLAADGWACVRADETPAGTQGRTSFKTVATLAGLGWIGRSGLLVTPEYGSAVRLWALLTDAPLPADEPVRASLCPDRCGACREICPAGAIRGVTWRRDTDHEPMVDAEPCRQHGLGLAGRLGLAHPTCGLCMTNCPLTLARLAGPARPAAPPAQPPQQIGA